MDADQQGPDGQVGNAEAEGIVDQQDAALANVETSGGPDQPEPTGVAQREGIVDQQDAALEMTDQWEPER